MKLGQSARLCLCCPSKPCITPIRRRRVACRLSVNSSFYDLQQYGISSTQLVPTEAQQHLDHIVRGAASAFGPLYFATFCALSITLGALLYNLTAVLNEYFAIQEQLTSKPKERPLLHGVDVSRSGMFQQPRVQAAADFAASAHAGQTRKTGEPYVTHCIETALIVEANLPHWRHDSRHETAVIAALLHDVLDDTATTPEQITAAFGPAVSAMVVKVSKLSQVNQMLRRDKRKGVVSNDASYWQSQWLRLKRMMFEAVVEEPLVILVKLADRLHNMRTVYALPPAKQQAVAEETLAVWCSMAASLGWHGIKSEMEDLCFAVVDQHTFCTLRQQLDKLWSSPSPPRSRRKVRSSRRQQQLQAFAQQQQEMADARAWAWEEGLGQSLRSLRSLLGFSRATLATSSAATAAAADVQPLATAPDSAFTDRSITKRHQGQNTVVEGSDSKPHAVAAAQLQDGGEPMQEQQKQSHGLHLVSRFWQRSSNNAAPALLPAPSNVAAYDQQDPQRASGADWGVTDAALSLSSLLDGSTWAAGLQQQQGGSDQLVLAGTSVALAANGPPAQKQQKQQKKKVPQLTVQQVQLKTVLSTVVPFDAVSLKGSRGLTWSAKQGLSVLEEAAGRLYNELAVGSFSSGLQVEIQGRLKSLRSIHNKMERKSCGIEEVYDARALRVVVDDAGGKRLADAVQCCYRLVSAVHKLWRPIHGEFDDYIANPKPSGYQALHTAVSGPGGAALEVQIKTSGMHEHAEYGGAAHWAYKEVLWGSAPAAAAAVDAVESAVNGSNSISSGGGVSYEQKSVEALPPVLFTFDDEGRLLSSSQYEASGSKRNGSYSRQLATAVINSSSSSRVLAGAGANSSVAAPAAALAGTQYAARGGVRAAVAVAERPAAQEQGQLGIPVLSKLASFSQRQQVQERPTALSSMQDLQQQQQPSSSNAGSGGPGSSSNSSRLWSSSPQQQQQPKPAPAVYVGQPVLRVADRLRYGVVLAVINDAHSSGNYSSSSSAPFHGAPAARFGSSTNPLAIPAGAGGVSAWSDPAASPSPGRVSLFCVIMSGGTNPDHPWRMPDYGFYQELLQYATAAGWVRPGQGDWHARLEEYEWCRDGRWHRRDHMGYLHPHTTLTLLEGYERDAAEAAAAAAAHQTTATATSSLAADTAPSSSTVVQTGGNSNADTVASVGVVTPMSLTTASRGKGTRNLRMLLHSWATGGSQNSRAAAQRTATADSKPSAADTGSISSTSDQTEMGQMGNGADSCSATASGGVQAAGPDWAATAAKAAQLRSVIEWGLEAYGVDESQQGGDVSVVIWPGGVIEDVPRGTTAGEILRDKGVFAILDATTESDSDSSESGEESSNSSSNASGLPKLLPGKRGKGNDSGAALSMQSDSTGALAAVDAASFQQPMRLVNVNNRLVSEDTVLSDGDLVILARERIKI